MPSEKVQALVDVLDEIFDAAAEEGITPSPNGDPRIATLFNTFTTAEKYEYHLYMVETGSGLSSDEIDAIIARQCGSHVLEIKASFLAGKIVSESTDDPILAMTLNPRPNVN